MTLGNQTSYAERLARVSSDYTTITNTSDATKKYINEGVRDFAKRVNGISKETYLTVLPKFDAASNFAIRLTITGGANAVAVRDLIISSNTYNGLGGASFASLFSGELSNTLGVSVSVSWDSASWVFVMYDELTDATAIEIESPAGKTYVDAVPMIFDKNGTQATYFFEGNLPVDCTVEIDLPSDYLSIEDVEWDGYALSEAPWHMFLSPASTGDPIWYAVKNKKIRLAPAPEDQEKCLLRYKHMPDDLETDGTEDAEECSLPTENHMAPVYYAASLLMDELHEYDKAKQMYSKFLDEVRRYRMRENNQDSTLFPQQAAMINYEVQIDEL